MFTLESDFEPRGDQPQAIKKILENFSNNEKKEQVLVGATGTGKTFTIANVIKNLFSDDFNFEKKYACLYSKRNIPHIRRSNQKRSRSFTFL